MDFLFFTSIRCLNGDDHLKNPDKFIESPRRNSGDFLMKIGLKISASTNETSLVLEISEVA